MRTFKQNMMIALFLAGMSGAATAQFNLHRTISVTEDNKAIKYATGNQYVFSGQIRPSTVNGWSNVASWYTLERIQLQILDNNLDNVWFKTYVADDEIQALPQCTHLSTEFFLEYATQTANGDYILCGEVRRDGETGGCSGPAYNHLFLMRVNSLGAVLWYNRYDVTGKLYRVIETQDGGFMACGHLYSGGTNALILKTDAGGAVQWSTTMNTPAYWDPNTYLQTEYLDICHWQSNVYALVGYGNHSLFMNSVLVTIIDEAGGIINNTVYDRTEESMLLTGVGICVADDGSQDLIITGNGGAPCLNNGAKLMIMRVQPSNNMNIAFLKLYGFAGDANYEALGRSVKCYNNTIAVCGRDFSNTTGLYVETDLSGNLLRYAVYDPDYYSDGKYVDINTNLGAPVISGNTQNMPEAFVLLNQYNLDCHADEPDIDVVDETAPQFTPREDYPNIHEIGDIAYEYDMENEINTVCYPDGGTVPNGSLKVPGNNTQTAGIRAYPNPAQNTVTFLGKPGQELSYEIRSITGQSVLKGKISSGETVNIESLPKGVYTAHIRTNDGMAQVIKIVKE